MPAVTNIVAGRPLTATGVIFRDATNLIAAPTDATTALNVGFKTLGYAGSDGLTETIDRTTEKVKAWGGDTVKVLQTDFSVQYEFILYETLFDEANKAVFGDTAGLVTKTGGTTGLTTKLAIKLKSDTLPNSRWVFDMKDGSAKVRIYVPVGQVTTIGEVTYSDENVVGYPVTVEAYPDATNVQAYKYTDDGVVVP
jgi:hypothetical protein